jgi:hypothetical protein
MPTIEFIDRGATANGHAATSALAHAATAARHAPSIFHSRPWRWRIAADTAELRLDRACRLPVIDPDGRLRTISCGAALHHACTALAAAGVDGEVTRLPDPADPDLLARITVTGVGAPPSTVVRLHEAMVLRHAGRRAPFALSVAAEDLAGLRAAAAGHGAHLHLFGPDDVVPLAVAVARAEADGPAWPEYGAEVGEWAARPDGFPDGPPARVAARPVPVGDFALGAAPRPESTEPVDRRARYAVLFADGDSPAAWLGAGEALSAVLLTATAERLAVSPMSDVVEVPATRQLLRELLAGIGYPSLDLRVGVPHDAAQPAGRRPVAEPVEVIGWG